jgi:hypothetical protein
MKLKFKPDITTNIVRTMDFSKYHNDGINIHHRDGKRIMQRKVWNSRKIHYDDDSFVCVMVVQSGWFDDDCKEWLLQLQDLKNGETRVTPMYEIEVVKHSHRDGHKNYIVFKKK